MNKDDIINPEDSTKIVQFGKTMDEVLMEEKLDYTRFAQISKEK
jgi:hypothetical protein